MTKHKYMAMVTYVHTAPNGRQIFESENLVTDYVPNTESGIKKISEKLMELYPFQENIRILGLIPLVKERNSMFEETDEDDDLK